MISHASSFYSGLWSLNRLMTGLFSDPLFFKDINERFLERIKSVIKLLKFNVEVDVIV
jgi:hypothetical protein